MIPLVRPPLVVLRAVLGSFSDFLFGWLDRPLVRYYEGQLARDIQLALKFLFTEYGARIVPNHGVPFPPAFDYAFITVEIRDFLIRFCRGRGELSAAVAS